MLELKNVYVRDVLKGLNLKVSKGEFVLIIGENGAGKSTLFNAISSSIKPSSGQVIINGQDIKRLSFMEQSSIVSYVLQDPRQGTVGEMSILENMSIAYMRGRKRLALMKKAPIELFKERLSKLNMGLENRLNDYAGNLSGGQRQALSLVMSTLSNYEVLLLDEITASLDNKSSGLVMQIAQNIAKNDNKICLAITHDPEYIKSFQGRIVELKNGICIERAI